MVLRQNTKVSAWMLVTDPIKTDIRAAINHTNFLWLMAAGMSVSVRYHNGVNFSKIVVDPAFRFIKITNLLISG